MTLQKQGTAMVMIAMVGWTLIYKALVLDQKRCSNSGIASQSREVGTGLRSRFGSAVLSVLILTALAILGRYLPNQSQSTMNSGTSLEIGFKRGWGLLGRIVCLSVGSFLILASTIVSGLKVSDLEDNVQENEDTIGQLEGYLKSSEDAADSASLSWRIAFANYDIVTSLGNPGYQDGRLDIRIATYSLYANAIEMLFATGAGHDDPRIQQLQDYRDSVDEGHYGSLVDMNDMMSDLMAEAGEYQGRLILEIADVRNDIDIVRKEIQQIRRIAVTLQVLGLCIILAKDILEGFGDRVTVTPLPQTPPAPSRAPGGPSRYSRLRLHAPAGSRSPEAGC